MVKMVGLLCGDYPMQVEFCARGGMLATVSMVDWEGKGVPRPSRYVGAQLPHSRGLKS
jgi:hypothetical protein